MKSVLDDDFYWKFSLKVYGRPHVMQSCLALQESIGLDVNVLLMALLAARWHRRAIAPQEIERADHLVRPWRREVVIPLRQIRTRLKAGPAPAPDARTDRFRNEVKAAELHAERIQQHVLAAWIDDLAPGPPEPADAAHEACRVTAARVTAFYAKSAGKSEALAAQCRDRAITVAIACAEAVAP